MRRSMGSLFVAMMLVAASLFAVPCMADPGKHGSVMYAAADYSALFALDYTPNVAALEMIDNEQKIHKAVLREPLTGTGLGLTAVNAPISGFAYVAAVAVLRQEFL